MRLAIFIILTINTLTSFSQFDINSSIENLDDWIITNDSIKKHQILDEIKNEYPDNCAFSFFNSSEFHIIDIDKNGLTDILYSGFCGIDGSSTQVFKFNGQNYDIILSVIGSLNGVIKKAQNSTFSLTINNYACCGGFTNVFETYVYTQIENTARFTLKSRYDYVAELVFPEEYLNKMVEFKTKQDIYKLRFSPEIDDTTEIARPYDDAFGNTIHTYSKNAMGLAIAEKKDKTGRVWWFVKMDNSSDPKMEYSKSFGDNNEQFTYSLGWMSSRYLIKK